MQTRFVLQALLVAEKCTTIWSMVSKLKVVVASACLKKQDAKQNPEQLCLLVSIVQI